MTKVLAPTQLQLEKTSTLRVLASVVTSLGVPGFHHKLRLRSHLRTRSRFLPEQKVLSVIYGCNVDPAIRHTSDHARFWVESRGQANVSQMHYARQAWLPKKWPMWLSGRTP